MRRDVRRGHRAGSPGPVLPVAARLVLGQQPRRRHRPGRRDRCSSPRRPATRSSSPSPSCSSACRGCCSASSPASSPTASTAGGSSSASSWRGPPLLAGAQRHDRPRPGRHRRRARRDVPPRDGGDVRRHDGASTLLPMIVAKADLGDRQRPDHGGLRHGQPARRPADRRRPVRRRRRRPVPRPGRLHGRQRGAGVAGRAAAPRRRARRPDRTSAGRSPRASAGSGATRPCGPWRSRSSRSTSRSARRGRCSCSTPSSGSTPARSASGCSRRRPRSAGCVGTGALRLAHGPGEPRQPHAGRAHHRDADPPGPGGDDDPVGRAGDHVRLRRPRLRLGDDVDERAPTGGARPSCRAG